LISESGSVSKGFVGEDGEENWGDVFGFEVNVIRHEVYDEG
jgi:hypothetical protein